ncbi:MAG: ATP-dependent helicase [Sandaracinaceae bacterium]
MARLNAAQRAAVEHAQGPLLVLAGAGSGKTRVITQRIARLIERGTRPEAILAVSFTNKAAAEMGERMVPLIGRDRAERLWLSTFHSFGVKFLGEESKALRYPSRFVIFDQGDSLGLVREIVRREGIADRQLDLYAVQSRISLWKNRGLTPDEIPASDFEYDAVAKSVYPHYEAALRSMCAVDFDDLVLQPVRILEARPAIRKKWQDRFTYMLIDEFQDTNRIQLDLVKLLANDLRNVCVVGDDDQSIYGWRGAEVGNILDFESHFAGAEVVKLEVNYRSYSPILEVANAAIARARRPRHEKVLSAARGPGDPVRLTVLDDAAMEAKFVAHEVRLLEKGGRGYGEMAVLYRSNLQARLIEEELRVAGIPYRLFGGTQLFDKKEVKDAIAYLRLLVHPRDELSLRRIVNYPARGIGDTSIERVGNHALAQGITFAQALERIDTIDVPDAAKRGAHVLLTALGRGRARVKAGESLEAIAEDLFKDVGLAALKDDERPAERKRWSNVDFVIRSIGRYEKTPGPERASLPQFLARMTLNVDAEAQATGQRVTLSSLHASKGLEFGVVFFIGLNEGQLPHSRTTDPKVTEAAPTDVEEERRLFYVGVTRAKDRLYLCRAQRRALRGRVTPLTPTRFLEGLPDEHVLHYDPALEAPASAEDQVMMGRALIDQLRGG